MAKTVKVKSYTVKAHTRSARKSSSTGTAKKSTLTKKNVKQKVQDNANNLAIKKLKQKGIIKYAKPVAKTKLNQLRKLGLKNAYASDSYTIKLRKPVSKKVGTYIGFDVYEKLPKGWKKDGDIHKAPGKGMVFITNGKSPLKGGKRALLKVNSRQTKLF